MALPRSEFLAGVRAELPILLGVIPFGVIYGVLALDAGLPVTVAMAMSSIIFAGSAQFLSTELFAAGTPGVIIVLTIFIVNLRHMLYSASLAPYLTYLPQRWKWLLAYLLTDEAYAVAITHYNRATDPAHKHWYFLGAGLVLWGTWQASTAAGIFLGAQAQQLGLQDSGLDFAIAVTFIALVVPALSDRAAAAAALSAGVVAVAAAGLPYNLGLMLAAFVGIGLGMAMGRKSP
jgi:4-azaleucine resistance transporter AzlC